MYCHETCHCITTWDLIRAAGCKSWPPRPTPSNPGPIAGPAEGMDLGMSEIGAGSDLRTLAQAQLTTKCSKKNWCWGCPTPQVKPLLFDVASATGTPTSQFQAACSSQLYQWQAPPGVVQLPPLQKVPRLRCESHCCIKPKRSWCWKWLLVDSILLAAYGSCGKPTVFHSRDWWRKPASNSSRWLWRQRFDHHQQLPTMQRAKKILE